MVKNSSHWIHCFLLGSLLAACGSDQSSSGSAPANSHSQDVKTQLPQTGQVPTPVLEYDPATDCYKAADFVCEVEAHIHRLTNELRVQQGLARVSHSLELTYAARIWSQTQAQANRISHDGFPQNRESVIDIEFGQNSSVQVLAENVAQNYMKNTAEETAKDIVQQWWESPGHRSNLLGNYPSLGVGIAFFGKKAYGTQLFGRAPNEK